MRKIICFLLILCLIISIPFGVTTASAAENEYFSFDFTPIAEKYSSINYYEFKNPMKVSSSKGFIAVLDFDKDRIEEGDTSLIAFDSNGKFLSETKFGDPRDVEVIDGTAFVLEYDLKAEKPTAHIFAVDLKTGDSVIALQDVSAKDLTSFDNYLYVLSVGIVQGVKRFTATSTGLIHDTSFVEDKQFANATAISASKNFILGYQSTIGIPTIFAINLTDKKRTEVTSLPSGGIAEFMFDGTNLYVLNEKGVFVGTLGSAPDFVPALLVDSISSSSSENLIAPISFSLDPGSSNSIYILDGLKSLSVKKFKYTSNILMSSLFTIGSFSSDKGAFNSPTDVCFSADKTYYADSLNNRIVMVSKNGKITDFTTIDENNKFISPKYIGVDYTSNIYVGTDKAIYKYSSSYKLMKTYTTVDDRKLSEITALYVSEVSDEVFAIDGSRLISLDTASDSFTIAKASGSSSKSLAIDMRFQRIITASESSIYVYDLKTFDRFQTIQVGANASFLIKDVAVDFDGSIFVLVGNKSFSYIYKLAFNDKGRYEAVGQARLGSDKVFANFAIDNLNSKIFLLPEKEHRAYLLESDAYENLNISYYNDLKIFTDIFDHTYDEKVTVGTVLESSNKLIFPLNSRDNLYPVNYAVTRARKLKANEKVVVAGYSEDKKYAYVICNNAAGFMDVDTFSVSDQLTDMPFKQGVSLHANMYVYKYPLVTVFDHLPLYSTEQISKDTPLTILNKASDYVSPSGLYWYKVSYFKDGKMKFGYVPRYNVVENLSITNPTLIYGKIDADVLHGNVAVYADLGLTPLGKTLLDNTEVIILNDNLGNYIYIQEVTEKGDGIVGYVLKENITTLAQTKSQQTALILIAILIVVVIILFVLKVVLKKVKRRR